MIYNLFVFLTITRLVNRSIYLHIALSQVAAACQWTAGVRLMSVVERGIVENIDQTLALKDKQRFDCSPTTRNAGE